MRTGSFIKQRNFRLGVIVIDALIYHDEQRINRALEFSLSMIEVRNVIASAHGSK